MTHEDEEFVKEVKDSCSTRPGKVIEVDSVYSCGVCKYLFSYIPRLLSMLDSAQKESERKDLALAAAKKYLDGRKNCLEQDIESYEEESEDPSCLKRDLKSVNSVLSALRGLKGVWV